MNYNSAYNDDLQKKSSLINNFLQLPAWGFGTSERMGKDKPRFDFYENNMFLDDPMQADLSRK